MYWMYTLLSDYFMTIVPPPLCLKSKKENRDLLKDEGDYHCITRNTTEVTYRCKSKLAAQVFLAVACLGTSRLADQSGVLVPFMPIHTPVRLAQEGPDLRLPCTVLSNKTHQRAEIPSHSKRRSGSRRPIKPKHHSTPTCPPFQKELQETYKDLSNYPNNP